MVKKNPREKRESNNDYELRNEFKRIYRNSKKVNLKKVSIVYNSIKKKQSELKKPSTITEVAADTGLKKTSVRTYIIHLEESKYIKKNKKYTPPFLKITDKKTTSEFIYGKDNRDSRIKAEVKKVLQYINKLNDLSNELKESIAFISSAKEYNSKFFNPYNNVVVYLWTQDVENDSVKLEIGSGANRYYIY